MSVTIDIPVYQSRACVAALQIKTLLPSPRGYEVHFYDKRFVPIQVSADWVSEYFPMPGGYMIFSNRGGSPTFMHQEIFEVLYSPTGETIQARQGGEPDKRHAH